MSTKSAPTKAAAPQKATPAKTEKTPADASKKVKKAAPRRVYPAATIPKDFVHPDSVPESLIKKRQIIEKNELSNAQRRLKLRASRHASRLVAFKRAEKYAVQYRRAERSLINLRRQAKHKQLLR